MDWTKTVWDAEKYGLTPGPYCRNPDPDTHPEGPWCYTDVGTGDWEYCGVVYCKREWKDVSSIISYHNLESCTSFKVQMLKNIISIIFVIINFVCQELSWQVFVLAGNPNWLRHTKLLANSGNLVEQSGCLLIKSTSIVQHLPAAGVAVKGGSMLAIRPPPTQGCPVSTGTHNTHTSIPLQTHRTFQMIHWRRQQIIAGIQMEIQMALGAWLKNQTFLTKPVKFLYAKVINPVLI